MSPVISLVLSSVLGLVTGAILAFQVTGGEESAARQLPRARIDARPAALFALGLALVGPLGVMARTHNLFGTEHDGQTVVDSGPRSRPGAPERFGFLFQANSERCAELLAQAESPNPESLETALRHLGPKGQAIVVAVPEPSMLRDLVEALCAP